MDDANEQQSKQKLKRCRKKTSSSRKKRAAIFVESLKGMR
jgi:hypothetical protein